MMDSTVSDLELSVKVSYSVVYMQENEKRKPDHVILNQVISSQSTSAQALTVLIL